MTDMNLLDITLADCPDIRILKTPKYLEKDQGTDWEWWVGNPINGWMRYAIQAKKFNTKSRRYESLNHIHDGIPQIQLLEEYASANNALPLYCLYNYTTYLDGLTNSSLWHCYHYDGYDAEQFGCTIVPFNHVQKCIGTRGFRTFPALHQEENARPLRCLLCSKDNCDVGKRGKGWFGFENIEKFKYKQLPGGFYIDGSNRIFFQEIKEMQMDFYRLKTVPRIIVVIYV